MDGMVQKLPDDKAGKLLKLILAHVHGRDVITDDLVIDIAFEPIKAQLTRDAEKWENTCKARSEAGKKGGRPKKQSKANKPIGFFEKQNKAKKADNDNDNDNVNVNDNVNDNDNENEKTAKASGKDSSDFLEFYDAYPKKRGKADALKAWMSPKNKCKPDLDELLKILNTHIQSNDWTKDNGQFIPNPSTWINQHRWEDEMEVKTAFKQPKLGTPPKW